jgi:hypothetical protein
MADTTAPGPRLTDVPAAALGELLRAVPRLVERTVAQAELARSLAAHVPCLGLVPGLRRPAPPADGGEAPAPAPISVLDVFDEPDADATDAAPAAPVVAAPEPTVVPAESELAVPDYDSLAASQVVPRLAMLSPEELRAVLAYEQANRHRQTILHRVDQLLEA